MLDQVPEVCALGSHLTKPFSQQLGLGSQRLQLNIMWLKTNIDTEQLYCNTLILPCACQPKKKNPRLTMLSDSFMSTKHFQKDISWIRGNWMDSTWRHDFQRARAEANLWHMLRTSESPVFLHSNYIDREQNNTYPMDIHTWWPGCVVLHFLDCTLA